MFSAVVSIVRFAIGALKALRVAPPALRAAEGLDRVVRKPRCAQLSTALARLLTRSIDGAIVQIFFTAAPRAAPPHRPMRSETN